MGDNPKILLVFAAWLAFLPVLEYIVPGTRVEDSFSKWLAIIGGITLCLFLYRRERGRG